MSINKVMISGNLTRDPELRALSSGTSVLNFGVAVNDRRRNADGQWEDVPNFVDCVVFGNRAEPLSRFLQKGSKVAIEGKLRYTSWERDGQRRSRLEVIVENLDFFSSRNNSAGGSSTNQASQYQQSAPQGAYQQSYAVPQTSPVPVRTPQQSAVSAPPSNDVYDEDIPF